MPARVISVLVGVFYLVSGGWSFFFPDAFYATVANFFPYNVHLLHDLGAFQVGLGLALLVPVLLRLPVKASLVAVLVASLLHLFAHLEDLRLGGHPTTDLPALALVVLALGAALVLEVRRPAILR